MIPGMGFTKRNAKRLGKKGGAAKARRAKAEAAAEPSAEPTPAGDDVLRYREIIEWVWDNLGEKRCPPAPNRKARELWRYAKGNPDGFLDKYVPLLVARDKEVEEQKEDDGGCEGSLALIDEFLAAYDKAHPNEGPKAAPHGTLQPGPQSLPGQRDIPPGTSPGLPNR
jgi:hypothetical protein